MTSGQTRRKRKGFAYVQFFEIREISQQLIDGANCACEASCRCLVRSQIPRLLILHAAMGKTHNLA
jgi:hypothetical protein